MSTLDSEKTSRIVVTPNGKHLLLTALAVPAGILLFFAPTLILGNLLPESGGSVETSARVLTTFALMFTLLLAWWPMPYRYNLRFAETAAMLISALLTGLGAALASGWATDFLEIDVAGSLPAYLVSAVAAPIGAGCTIYWFERRWRIAGREADPFVGSKGERKPDAPEWEPLSPGALVPSPLFGFSVATAMLALVARLNFAIEEIFPAGEDFAAVAILPLALSVMLGLPLTELSPRGRRQWAQLAVTLYAAFLSLVASVFLARLFLASLVPEGDAKFIAVFIAVFMPITAVGLPLIWLFQLSLRNLVRPGGSLRDAMSARLTMEKEKAKTAGLAPLIFEQSFPRILVTFLPLLAVLVASQIAYFKIARILDLWQYLDVVPPLLLVFFVAAISRPRSFRHVVIVAAWIMLSTIPALLFAAFVVRMFAGPVESEIYLGFPLKLAGEALGAGFVIAAWSPIILATRHKKLWVLKISERSE